MGKRIVVINGNPACERETFTSALAQAYRKGAEGAGHKVRSIDVAKMNFDPILHEGYHGQQFMEPDVLAAQEAIKWAEHLVIVYPMWQFNIPALLKGFCERTLTPEFAYRVDVPNPLDASCLKGRTARLIQTMGMPAALYGIGFGAHGGKAFKTMLAFCGIKPVKACYLGLVEGPASVRESHLVRVTRLGRAAR